ncbi:MAG: family er yigZ [Bacteroidota bacterium]
MKNKYQYKTILKTGYGEYRDRGSKFIAHSFPIEKQDQINIHLEEIRKLHGKASHYCYAWRLGLDGLQYRANDDGEPSGTAGKPILGQIDSAELTNTLVVVTRYFGGTLLGTSGLINAYRNAAALAIENAEIIEKELSDYYLFICDYTKMPLLLDTAKKHNLLIIKQEFDIECKLTIQFPQSKWKDKIAIFLSNALDLRIDQVESDALFPDLQWELSGTW